jgi:hypothetical protein
MYANMRFEDFAFGWIRIDGVTYDHDVVIERGEVRKRNKKPSKDLRAAFGHTPLSSKEEIPWKCRKLVVGTGMHGALPVTGELRREAKHRKVEVVILPTPEAIEALKREDLGRTNAILHVTC